MKNYIYCVILLCSFTLHAQTPQIEFVDANGPISTRERSLCSFTYEEKQYELKLQKSGLTLENQIAIIEEVESKKAVRVKLGTGKQKENLEIAAANWFNNKLYVLLTGLLAPGKYTFYRASVGLDGEANGDLKELKVPLNNAASTGTPKVFQPNNGEGEPLFSLLAFFPSSDDEMAKTLTFSDVKNYQVGFLILNNKFEPQGSEEIQIDGKADQLKIKDIVMANEGDIMLATSLTHKKKTRAYVGLTHAFRLNKVSWLELVKQTEDNITIKLAQQGNRMAVAWCASNKSNDASVFIKLFNKGGGEEINQYEVKLNPDKMNLKNIGKYFALKEVYLRANGVFVLGAYYDQKKEKKDKTSLQPKIETFYSLTGIDFLNNQKETFLPVFSEYGSYSPSYYLGQNEFCFIYNTHKNNLSEGTNKYKVLGRTQINSSAVARLARIDIQNWSTQQFTLFQAKAKIRLITTYSVWETPYIWVDAISKEESGKYEFIQSKRAKIKL